MFYDHYVLAPDYLRKELEYIVTGSADLRGIKTEYFSSSIEAINAEAIPDIIRKFQCHNDVLLLCDRTCPEVSMPEEYCGYLTVNEVESISDLFVEKRILQEHEKEDTFVVVAGLMGKWEDNLGFIDQFDGEPGRSFSERYSSILVLDTGLHFDLVSKAEQFSEHTGIPFNILFVGMEYFQLNFDKILLQWSVGKKQDQLKLCNKKAASYAMSLDFIKTIADVTDESMAIESICKLFSMMFAPKDIVYYSLYGENIELKYFKHSEPEKNDFVQLKDSDDNYIVFEEGDGFAMKISTTDELLGIIEIYEIAFPEYIDEYLSTAYDLAKGSGLAISNIRRYHELFSSREEQAKMAELLRTTNRILRHDIANDLHIVLGALDLLEEKNDMKFISMIRKAANKSVSLIKDVKELDLSSSDPEQLIYLDIRHIIDSVIGKYDADFSVKGDCMIMADKALVSVLDNLISNAHVHGNASKVNIDIQNRDGICEVSIADNGKGIPDEVKSKVFDEGFKYGSTGNTGFGLFIAKQTIKRYNGSIRVEDNDPSGAKFIIELAAAERDDTAVN